MTLRCLQLLSLLLCTLACAGRAFAQSVPWPSVGPVGGNVIAIATGPDGTLYVATAIGGVFRSSDAGASWTDVSRELEGKPVNAVAVARSGAVLADARGIMRSTDRGASWRSANSPAFIAHTILPLADGSTIVVDQAASVYRVNEGSDAWNVVATGQSPRDFRSMVLAPPGMIFAGTDASGVLRSADGGLTWYSTGGMGSDQHVRSIAVDSAGVLYYGSLNGRVFRSTDNGMHWDGLLFDSIYARTIVALAISDDDYIYAADSSSRVYVSSDAGGHWRASQVLLRSGHDALNSASIGKLIAAPSGVVIAIDAVSGIYRSTDHGTTWQYGNVGLTDSDIPYAAVSPAGDLFALSSFRLFRRSAGTATWDTVSTQFNFPVVNCIAFDSSGGMYLGCNGGRLWYSSNRGSKWIDRTTSSQTANIYALGIARDGALYAGTKKGMFRSDDSGKSWKSIWTSSVTPSVLTFGIDPNGVMIAGATNLNLSGAGASAMMRSSDGGASWVDIGPIPNNGYPRAIAISSSGTILMTFANTELRRSTDHGETWSWVAIPWVVDSLSLAVDAQGEFYLGALEGGVFRSTDEGITWSDVSGGLMSLRVKQLTAARDGAIYASTSGGGIFSSKAVVGSVTEKNSTDNVYAGVVTITPNPVSDVLTIDYLTAVRGPSSLALYDPKGERIMHIQDGVREPGRHRVSVPCGQLQAGIYLVTLTEGSHVATRKILIVR